VDLSVEQDLISPLPWNPSEGASKVTLPFPLPLPPLADDMPKISGKSPGWKKQPDSQHTNTTHANTTFEEADKPERQQETSASPKDSPMPMPEDGTAQSGSANEVMETTNALQASIEPKSDTNATPPLPSPEAEAEAEKFSKLPQTKSADSAELPAAFQIVAETRRSLEHSTSPSVPNTSSSGDARGTVGSTTTQIAKTTPVSSPTFKKNVVDSAELPAVSQNISKRRLSIENAAPPYVSNNASPPIGARETMESTTRTKEKPRAPPTSSPVMKKDVVVDGAELPAAFQNISKRRLSIENATSPSIQVASPTSGARATVASARVKPNGEAGRPTLLSSPDMQRRSKVFETKNAGNVELPAAFQSISNRKLSIENATSPSVLVATSPCSPRRTMGSAQVKPEDEARSTLPSSPDIHTRSKIFETKKTDDAELPAVFQNISNRRLSIENATSPLGSPSGGAREMVAWATRSQVKPKGPTPLLSPVFKKQVVDSADLPSVFQNISKRRLSIENGTSPLVSPSGGARGTVESTQVKPKDEARPTLLSSPDIQRHSRVFETKKADGAELPSVFKNISKRKLSIENGTSPFVSPSSGAKGTIEEAPRSPVKPKGPTPLSSPVFKKKVAARAELPAVFQNISKGRISLENPTPSLTPSYASPSGRSRGVVESAVRKAKCAPMSSPVFKKKVANVAGLPTAFQATFKRTSSIEKPTTAPSVQVDPGDDKYHPLADLQQRKVEGIDYNLREQYLAPDEFEKHFQMSKESFSTLPKWKRDRFKRALGLF
jgi:hypothetical protein